MKGNIFIDSNIVVYSYSDDDRSKCDIARNLIAENNTFISTQVLQELCNVLLKKFAINYNQIISVIKECCNNNNLHNNSYKTILLACEVVSKYKFSFYDSLIIAASLECDCSELYSEDLQDGQIINQTLKVINPFKI